MALVIFFRVVTKNLNYTKSNNKICKYMKFYNFLLLTKSKSKKGLIRNKMRIENVDMIIIKWERVWNEDRKEKNGERERKL